LVKPYKTGQNIFIFLVVPLGKGHRSVSATSIYWIPLSDCHQICKKS